MRAFVAIGTLFVVGGGPVTAQSTSTWTTNRYTVTGTNIPQLRATLARDRPPQLPAWAQAYTRWTVVWRFARIPTPTGCSAGPLITETTVQTILPEWVPSGKAPVEVHQAWKKYLQALADHEKGHGDLANQAAVEMRRRVEALAETTTCDQLSDVVNQTCERVMEEYRQKEREYDRETRHGAAQGAMLGRPPGPEGGRPRGGPSSPAAFPGPPPPRE